MAELHQTTAAEAMALAIAKATISPPENATASKFHREVARSALATLEKAGWKLVKEMGDV